MSKKKLKKMLRKAMKNGFPANTNDGYGGSGGDNGYGFPGGFSYGDKERLGKGFLGNLGLPRRFGEGQTEQFIIGALLGAAAAYVLADEELRSKIMKSIMKLYAGLTGGIEEFKEQMADLKAEIQSERGV